MSLNSINTNTNAAIALQSLNATSSELSSTEKQISTGCRVADATEDGAAYAVAQRVRSDVGALTSVNQQLGNVKGLLSTTVSSLNNVSNALISARAILVKLSGTDVQGNTRNQYVSQYQSLISNVKAFIQDSTYAGKSLVGNLSQTGGAIPSSYGGVAVTRNETGASYSIGAFSGSALYAQRRSPRRSPRPAPSRRSSARSARSSTPTVRRPATSTTRQPTTATRSMR